MNRYDIILWDVDQTLLNFEKSKEYALHFCFEHFGLEINERIIERYSAINALFWKRLELGEVTRSQLFTGRFEELFKELGICTVTAQQIAPVYQKALGEVYYYQDDSLKLCRRLKEKGIRQYVLTNGFGPTQHNKLRISGLGEIMDGIFVSEEIGYSKPAPEYFAECFRRIQDFRKESALMVGDSLTGDMQGANAAQVAACWYNPQNKRNDLGCRIDHEIRNLWEVEDIILCQNHPIKS